MLVLETRSSDCARGNGPNAFGLMPKPLFHQDASLDKQLRALMRIMVESKSTQGPMRRNVNDKKRPEKVRREIEEKRITLSNMHRW